MDINYDDERWAQIANSIPPETPSDDLSMEIEKQYSINQSQLAENQKSIPVKLSKNMDEINESIYASSKAIASSKHSKELIHDLQKNRLIGLRILSQEIKYATSLTYQNLLKPVRSLMKQFHQADIRAYKRDIGRITKQYEKTKEGIDKKARKRLRRINLFNMRRGYFIYDEKTLPYTEAEQWKMDKYISRLKVLDNLLQDSENRLAKVISAEEKHKNSLENVRETIVSLKDEQKQPYIVKEEVKEKETIVSDSQKQSAKSEKQKPVPSIDKEFNKNQNTEMKKMEQGVPDSVIKDLKKQYLTNGQYHAALLVSQKFPHLQIEKDSYLKEMDPPKIVMAAYILDKSGMEAYNLERLSKLSTVEMVEMGHYIDKGLDKAEAWRYVNDVIIERNTDITQSEDLDVNEAAKEFENAPPAPEMHSNEDNNRSEIYDNTSLFDRSFTENMRIAADAALLMQATRAYELIKNSINENRSVDFDIEGEAYRAQKDHSGSFSFMKYNYDSGEYTPISKDEAIRLISCNSNNFLAFVKSEKSRDNDISAPGVEK